MVRSLMLLLASVPAASAVVVSSSMTAGEFHLRQYNGKFCSGRYVALDLREGMMEQKNLPDGRQPDVLCNKLEKNADDTYTVHSCPGDSQGCPMNCDSCAEDMVKHFTPGQCAGGWMLVEGASPEDCRSGHEECSSANQVDVGLARWCGRWPSVALKAKSADDLEAEASKKSASQAAR
mmetsp:Transcript_30427/g.90319  ORF Transcript_30427/g.90319 Transcript_30427/m.90319 type:complete len:178 (+) Transcript_30427:59-592(+)